MRIRLKAETSNEKIEEDDLTVIGTEDGALVAEGEAVDSISDERSSEPSQISATLSRDSSRDSQSTSNVKGKDKDDSSTVKSDAKQATEEAQNLIGKINNLVTTDLGNIVRGLDFLLISALQSFRFGLDSLSDTFTSSIYPTSNSPVHYLLIRSTWVEVSFPSYSYSYLRELVSLFSSFKCLCWHRYDAYPVSGTRIYC